MRHRIAFTILLIPAAVGVVAAMVTDPLVLFPWSMPGLTALVVGIALAWKVPANPISWLLFVFGCGFAAGFGALATLPSLVNEDIVGWLDAVFSAINTATVVLLPLIFIRFPDGAIGTRGDRVLEWMAILGAGLGFFAALFNGGWGGDPGQANFPSPLYETTRPFGDVLAAAFFALFVVSMLGAAISLILRFRQSTGETRLQFRWLAFSALLIVMALSAVFLFGGAGVATDELWEQLLTALGFASIPVAIGISVLKYRLYDIDVVTSRTLVLAVLLGFITLTYAAVVVGLGRMIGGELEGLLLPIAATALVAVAFEPVRLRAQRWANRLVYGNRATPYEVLSDITTQLANAEVEEGLLQRLADLLMDGTGAEVAVVWLGEPGEMSPGASAPQNMESQAQPVVDDDTVFAVNHDGQIVGALEVVKSRGSQLSTTERSLISDLAGSAGAVLGYQRLNDSLAAKALELEQSRARLLGAQDQERRRLERELHEGAEQYIVALKVKIGVASQLAAQEGAHDLVKLLDGLSAEAQEALDDVQNLAKGIYPPILESDGLAAAISALATASPVEIEFERDGVGRYRADVEAAVYFDISEAVTNAVKHAEPPIRIELAEADGTLSFLVRDQGPGFDIDGLEKGSGLENMADRLASVGGRLEIDSAGGQPTLVAGAVPVG